MTKKLSILVFAFSHLLLVSYGQHDRPNPSLIISNLFKRISEVKSDSVRLSINDSIRIFIDSYAESDSIFEHSFSDLKYLGQISSRKCQIKIITWNLLLGESKSRYYCYFINRSNGKNVVTRLTADYSDDPIKSDISYTQNDWYGALYYDIREYDKGSQIYWVLLGINFGNPAITRKIIDVISFDDDGRIIFGKKIFKNDDETKFREVLEYSSEALASLKFLSDKTIVFDHLVPFSPELKDQKEFYGPDFSYDSYNLEKGLWIFEQNVDVRNKK